MKAEMAKMELERRGTHKRKMGQTKKVRQPPAKKTRPTATVIQLVNPPEDAIVNATTEDPMQPPRPDSASQQQQPEESNPLEPQPMPLPAPRPDTAPQQEQPDESKPPQPQPMPAPRPDTAPQQQQPEENNQPQPQPMPLSAPRPDTAPQQQQPEKSNPPQPIQLPRPDTVPQQQQPEQSNPPQPQPLPGPLPVTPQRNLPKTPRREPPPPLDLSTISHLSPLPSTPTSPLTADARLFRPNSSNLTMHQLMGTLVSLENSNRTMAKEIVLLRKQGEANIRTQQEQKESIKQLHLLLEQVLARQQQNAAPSGPIICDSVTNPSWKQSSGAVPMLETLRLSLLWQCFQNCSA